MPAHVRLGWALGGLLAASLLLAGFARLGGIDPQQRADAPAKARIGLLFEDRADGAVLIRAAADGALLREIAPGTQGFVRSTLRGLARERKRQGVGADVPFELIARADGRLTLVDPATRRRVDLEAFGPSNAAPFVELLAPALPPGAGAAALRRGASADPGGPSS
jgi:putative photosynthetic complex assembly protein